MVHDRLANGLLLSKDWMLEQHSKTVLALVNKFIGQFSLLFAPMEQTAPSTWRQAHIGHWLALASRRFDARVLALMARHVELPLALSHLVARGSLSASHIHITRHLALSGSRLTELAQRAGMSKQAMGKLVEQCEAWGLVTRQADAQDARARRIVFSATGLVWLRVFELSVRQAEQELHAALGSEVATVMTLGLEAYVS
jgi:DNA-binding MarR family transcriptional regulator